jgi:hypothetical protein
MQARRSGTIMRSMRAALLAFALLLLLPAAAPAKTLDLPTLFEDVLPKVKDRTEVPVLLPQQYRSESEVNVPSGSGRTRGYTLSISAIRGCGGAGACFLAEFGAQRGEQPHYTRKVALTGGRTGYFKPLSCGASCSPPAIEWVEDGVLYWIQADAGTKRQEKKRLRRMANSAIRHGAR